MGNQGVRLGFIEPYAVGHRCIDVDDHDVSPVRGSSVAVRAIDAKCRP
jgi:hypothetical protein